jgi:hypothetical protein
VHSDGTLMRLGKAEVQVKALDLHIHVSRAHLPSPCRSVQACFAHVASWLAEKCCVQGNQPERCTWWRIADWDCVL